MKAIVDGKVKCSAKRIDILVTGCEVSLWVAEQFVADLRHCFPGLFIDAVSSNKLLGLFGQELTMPCTGFPYSQRTMDMKDPIVIIVSHSGGTFGPLVCMILHSIYLRCYCLLNPPISYRCIFCILQACSNLLQSFSSSIFAVTSEWGE